MRATRNHRTPDFLGSVFVGACLSFAAFQSDAFADPVPSPTRAAPAAQVSGLVMGSGDVPVAGQATLAPLPANAVWHRDVLAGSAVPAAAASDEIGEDGRFGLEVPASGVWSVTVTAPGRVLMRYSPLPVTESLELPPVELAADAGLEVEVRWRDGRPAADAWVLLTSESPELWRPLRRDGWQAGLRFARTDAGGRATLPRLAGEALSLHVIVGGRRSQTAVEAGAARAVVALAPASGEGWIEVRTPDGAPAADVLVAAGQPAWAVGLTGSDGRLAVTEGADGVEGPFTFVSPEGWRVETAELPAAEATGAALVYLEPWPQRTGKVLDAASGRPLTGALVWPGSDPGAFAFADPKGSYAVAPSRRDGWIQAEAAGFLPRASRLPPAGEALATLALAPARSLRGQVVDPTGRPIGGAVITADPPERPRYDVFRPDSAASRAVSDGGGRFELRRLSDAPAHAVHARRSGYQQADAKVTLREPIRLVLTPARAAHGRVVDGDDRPIVGASVTVRPAGGASARALVEDEAAPAVTDREGRFHLSALPADRIDLEARAPGYAPLVVPGIAVPAGSGPADLGVLALLPGARIAGRVTDLDGEPLAGAKVWLNTSERLPGPAVAEALRSRGAAAVSGADGRFVIGDRPFDERVDLLVARDGFLPAWRLGVETPPARPLVVALEPAVALRGWVRAADTLEPVAGAQVRLRPTPPPQGTVGLEARRSENTDDVYSDEDGAFTFAEVAPGGVLVQVTAKGFLPGEPLEVEVPADALAPEVVLDLDRGATVDGRVTDSGGAPVAAVQLRLGPARATSDAEGRYQLSGVPLGLGGLYATHPAYLRAVREVEVVLGGVRVDLTLEEGLSVAGRVVDEGDAPVPGATVILRPRRERGPRGFRATSDADGRFKVLALVDGEYDLEAEAVGYAPAALPQAVVVAGRDVAGLELVLRRGATLTGRILGVDFEAIARVEVSAARSGGRPRIGRVDYQSRYQIANLEPGDWRVQARLTGSGREAERWVTITESDREVELDLELDGGLALAGRVLFERRPLPGAVVGLRDLSGLERHVRSDYQGAFRLENLPPGHYRLEVVHAEWMLSQSQELDLDADREIEIEITPAVVSGSVLDAETGEGLADALVYLQRFLGGGEPGPLTTVGTDGEGSFVTASLAPGSYQVTVRRDGYAPAERQVEVRAGTVAEPLLFELEPTGGLPVVVRRAVGSPPAVATVVAFDAAGQPVHFEELILSDFGNGYLRQVPPGTWTLLFKAVGSSPAVLQTTVPGPALEVVLPPGAPLAVRVASLRDSQVAAALTLTDAAGLPHFDVEPSGSLRQSWPLIGGVATVPDLPAGSWRLVVTATDGRVWSAEVVTSGQAAATVEME